MTYLLSAAVRMPSHNKREHQYFDKILPDRWGCGVRLLNSARRQGRQEFARVLPNMSTQTVVAEMQGALTRTGLMSPGRDSDKAPG